MHDNRKLVIEYDNFKILQETEKFILGYLWEEVCLYDKVRKKEIFLHEFYGEIECGLLCDKEEWCVIGGDVLVVWKNKKNIVIDRKELNWVHDLKKKNSKIVEIFIDPWSDNAAIWELNIDNLNLKKISEFDNHKNKLYSEKVKW
ncbi:hypothetical protein [Anaeromicrobium sediminis]|uniref:Uncharacterized protein n=1 Tax=Anaeromicrobium sediminis TaxID=1478221 RepID=A0A267M788_9FIRM|nr:hypothetical protein [Anaeromicrobium sediminis]PAB55464.1 hypothetical protein CCE28_21740 [Anaeromicrobium sediminis]